MMATLAAHQVPARRAGSRQVQLYKQRRGGGGNGAPLPTAKTAARAQQSEAGPLEQLLWHTQSMLGSWYVQYVPLGPLVMYMTAVPDYQRTSRFAELLKEYESDGRNALPAAEVRDVLLPVVLAMQDA